MILEKLIGEDFLTEIDEPLNITKNFRWISLNDSANTKIYTNKSLSDEKIREGYRKQRIIERIRPVI